LLRYGNSVVDFSSAQELRAQSALSTKNCRRQQILAACLGLDPQRYSDATISLPRSRSWLEMEEALKSTKMADSELDGKC